MSLSKQVEAGNVGASVVSSGMAQEGTLPRDASESDEFTSWEDDLGTVGVVVEPPCGGISCNGASNLAARRDSAWSNFVASSSGYRDRQFFKVFSILLIRVFSPVQILP